MIIVIDGQTILGKKSGFGFYTKNLVENLKKIDEKNEYFLVDSGWKGRMSTLGRIWWDQVGFVRRAKKLKADIVHQPCFSVPIFGKFKKVVTIHDLIPIKFPKNFGFFSRMFFTKFMPFTYRFADKIITVSENTKKDLVEILGIDACKIKVIYEACCLHTDYTKETQSTQKLHKILEKYNIKQPYLLYVGTLEPRKNVEFLIKVFSEIRKLRNWEIKKLGNYETKKLKLVLVGKRGWGYEKMFKLIKDLKIEDDMIWTDYVEDKDLAYIYNGASLFVFPSMYEGFGLPLLEAMACGVPVVASNTSSIPEVVGEAGILIDPKDNDRWVKEIMRVLRDEGLQIELRKKGLERVKKFSWREAARRTLEIYCNSVIG